MKRVRAFFRAHPRIHTTFHGAALAISAILLVQDKILGASAFFAGSNVPQYIAWGLGILTFSNLLIGAADQQLGQLDQPPAAPTNVIPISEAITTELNDRDIKTE
jgi:hypothetical protein